jgi:putative polyhydroxyalkanoate system protein
MASATVRHQLETSEAKRRVKDHIQGFANDYGLKVRWNGDELVVSGKGITVSATFEPERVAIELDKAWYLPISEGRILDGIQSELKEALR